MGATFTASFADCFPFFLKYVNKQHCPSPLSACKMCVCVCVFCIVSYVIICADVYIICWLFGKLITVFILMDSMCV